MAINPLKLILGGAQSIINQGKSAVNSFLDAKDNSTAGIIRNTITGLVPAGKKVATDATTVVKDSVKQLVKPAVDLVKGEGTYAPQTGAGVARNTLLGIPQATVDTGKEILQGTARTVGTVGITAGNVPTQISNKVTGQNTPLPFDSEIPTNQNPITRAVFGGKPIKDFLRYGQGGVDFINELNKGNPDAKPASPALKVPFAIAGIALDLGGGGGKAKLTEKIVKDLVEAESDDVAKKILMDKLKFSEQKAAEIAPELAASKTPEHVYEALGAQNNKVPMPQHLEEKKVLLDVKKEAIESSPFNSIDKRSLMSEGTAREIGDTANPEVIRKMEKAMADTGITDPTEFAAKLDQFNAQKAAYLADKQAFNAELRSSRVPLNRTSPAFDYLEKVIKNDKNYQITKLASGGDEDRALARIFQQRIDEGKVPKNVLKDFYNKSGPAIDMEGGGILSPDNGVRGSHIMNFYDNPTVRIIADENRIKSSLDTVINSKLPAALKSEIVGLAKRPPLVEGTGQARSLEKAAEQSRLAAQAHNGLEIPSLPSMVSESTPLAKKVGFLDYLRTPEHVLKKIGLDEEAKMLRGQYEKYVKELPKEIDKISAWAKSVPKESNERIFRYLDNENVDLNPQELKVADEVKKYLAQWADRLGLPEDKRVSHYITHLFDDQLVKKEFDEDLAKIIRDRIPGEVYDPFLQQRLGAKGYKQDTWAALDAYVKRATRKVNLDPALEKIKKASEHLEDSQWNYMKSYVDNINMRPNSWDNLLDNSIKQSPISYRLGARPTAAISRALRQNAFRGMLGANVGSALRNLSQGINTFAKLGTKDTALGYLKFLTKGKSAIKELEEVGVLADNFVTDRSLSATKKAVEKLDKGLFVFFDTAEKVNRGAAYFGAKAKAIAKGMSEQDAIEYAKKLVRDTQFNYGRLDTPVTPLLSSDIGKVFLQFLTYPVKQTEFLAGMAKNKEYMGIARYVLGGLAFMYTVGKAFGMSPKDLVPFQSYVSGESQFGVPPSLKLPAEIIKAGMNAPDKFGKERTAEKKLSDIGNAAWGIIPGGIQLKHTLQGITDADQGAHLDKAGKKQFEIGQSRMSKAQAMIFGSYASSNAKEYFAGNTASKKEMDRIYPVYEEAQRLKASGDTAAAAAIVDNLSDADYEIYKKVKQTVTTANTVQGKRDIAPTYAQVQQLKAEGKIDEATAIVDALSDDEYKYYRLVKKAAEKDAKASEGQKPEYDDGEAQTEKGMIHTVVTYAKALGIDPAQAFNAMFTKEKLRYAQGNVVVVDRLPLAESQKIKRDQNGNTSGFKLDHVIPLEMGGSNDESNLKLVPTEQWASYTKVENFLGKALREGKIDRKKAQKAIRDFKDGTITAEDAMNVLQ